MQTCIIDIAWRTIDIIDIYWIIFQLPGVDFINLFGEMRMAKSAKSPANCRKNYNSVHRKSSKLFLAYGNQRKAAFWSFAQKSRELMKLMPGLPFSFLIIQVSTEL
jgi:hypothetical protein